MSSRWYERHDPHDTQVLWGWWNDSHEVLYWDRAAQGQFWRHIRVFPGAHTPERVALWTRIKLGAED